MNVGVIIARLQVPTLTAAQRDLLQHVFSQNDYALILLGVSEVDGLCAENPLSFAERVSMLTDVIDSIESRPSVTVLPLFNRRKNDDWSAQVDELVGRLFPRENIRLYGGRDSFQSYYTGKYPVHTFTPADEATRACSGSADRKALQPLIESHEFRLGKIYALNMQYPHAYPTVDIACVKRRDMHGRAYPQPMVLLIQRADTNIWCFPGGFVDPTDKSLEVAAARELHEETGILCSHPPSYLGSTLVKDWRYRGRDKILTTLMLAEYSWGQVQIAREEVSDFMWAPVWGDNFETFEFAEEHQPLLVLLRNGIKDWQR